MVNEKQIDELVDSMLDRPQMYASNPESLMGQVLTALYIKTGRSLWKDLFVFGQKYFDLSPNAAPFHLRLELSVREMRDVIVEFLTTNNV